MSSKKELEIVENSFLPAYISKIRTLRERFEYFPLHLFSKYKDTEVIVRLDKKTVMCSPYIAKKVIEAMYE